MNYPDSNKHTMRQASQLDKSMLLTWIMILFSVQFLFAENDNQENYQVQIKRAKGPILLDGLIDEADWNAANVYKDFWVNQPSDNLRADRQTEIRMTYDDKFIYLAVELYGPDDYVIQTLKRDAFGSSDEFAVFFDPVNQATNGYGFGVNALGAQSEALMTVNDGDPSWDNKWFSETRTYPDRWTIEMAVPFKSIRFEADRKIWGINFMRIDAQHNETHVWAPVPVQFDANDLGYTGALIWEDPPQKTGTNISIIPYVRGSVDQDFAMGDTTMNFRYTGGADAKISITPSLNLDITVNPDFSQVEVDQQVTNLTRFNIFFPERRNFFLENADIFNEFGAFPEQPFFSRSIGLDNQGQTIPILFGARLSGNLNKQWRAGFLSMQTRGDSSRHAQNYSAVAFHRRIGKRSLVKGMFLNRQAFDGLESVSKDYGRNAALEGLYSSDDGKWQAWGGYIQAFQDEVQEKNYHLHGAFAFNGKKFRTFLRLQHMGENYSADMGFIGRLFNFDPETEEFIRIGFTQVSSNFDYFIFPKDSEKVNYHWTGLENYIWLYDNGGLNEWYTRLRHFIFFKNSSVLRFRLNNNFVDLRFPFQLTDGDPLPAQGYNFTEFNIHYNSDNRKPFNFEIFTVYGSFYAGTKYTLRPTINYRIQPWANFALGFEWNDIRFPEPYGNASLWLINPRIEINFSKSLFWTTFLQYNTQADNFNVNSRLQWRFAPMSDVFLIYNDNYQVEGLFGPKNRALILKVSYWLTI